MPTQNKVVVRCLDGRKIKGFTWDFSPAKAIFHIVDPGDDKQVTDVPTLELKAIFSVKTFDGDPDRGGPPDYSKESLQGIPGLKLKVTFQDGEVMYGTTNAYSPGRKGFFVLPADKTSNNERVYVPSASARTVDTWR
jgi:hypothetical protein